MTARARVTLLLLGTLAPGVTKSEVVDNAQDLEAYGRERFAERFVVHVPIPTEAVRCDDCCSDQPWVLTDQ